MSNRTVRKEKRPNREKPRADPLGAPEFIPLVSIQTLLPPARRNQPSQSNGTRRLSDHTRLKQLERENRQLKFAVADFAVRNRALLERIEKLNKRRKSI
jgi:hypothetical protein